MYMNQIICHVLISIAFTQAKYFQQKKARMIQIVSLASKNNLVIDRKNGKRHKPDIHHFALVLISQKKENQYKPHLLRTALPSPQPSFSRKHCNTTPCSEAKFLLVFYFLFKIRRKKLSQALCQRQKRILKMMLVKSRAGMLSQPPNVTSAQQSCNTGCTFSLCTSAASSGNDPCVFKSTHS